MKILMVIAFFAFLIYGLEAAECSDKLPAKMTTHKSCKKLKKDCSKLKTMCSEKLMDAFGDGNDAKKCAKALKEDAKQRVETFCLVTCMKCETDPPKPTEDTPDMTTDCEDLFPAEMGKGNCGKLNQSCQKLKAKCSKSLKDAIGNTGTAKKCKKTFWMKAYGDEMVDTFCPKTCEACATTHAPPPVDPPTGPPNATWYDCAHAGGIDRPWNDFSSIEVMSPCPTNKPLQFECEARGKRYTSPTIPPMNLLSTECKDFAGGSLWQSAATDKEHVLDIDESNPSCSQPSLSGGDLYLHFTQDFYCAGDRASFGNLLWSFAIHYLAEQPIPYVDFYKGNGGFPDYLCRVLLDQSNGDFTKDKQQMMDIGCGNDRVRSMIICHAKRETTIKVYDGESPSSNNGAWAEIHILKDLDDCETISTFENTATYENYEVDYKGKGNLDGKVSSFEVFYDPGRVNTCNDSEFWCNMISDYECKHDLARDKCPATCSQCNDEEEGSGEQ